MLPGNTIESAMTPYLYAIEMDAHVSSAKAMLAQFRIRHLAVKDGEALAGIITARDIERAEECGIDTAVGSDVRVRKLCNKEVYVVAPEEPLVNVLKYMAEHYIDSALIARHGRLAGVFTFTDALKRYAEILCRQRGAASARL